MEHIVSIETKLMSGRQIALVKTRLFEDLKTQLMADGWSSEDATKLAKARVKAD